MIELLRFVRLIGIVTYHAVTLVWGVLIDALNDNLVVRGRGKDPTYAKGA